MATSSFFDTFTFADPEEQEKFFKESNKATQSPPERPRCSLCYSRESEKETLDFLKSLISK